ncbi:MAG: RNA-binding cell elongation regulator Jag/EloR, partial [Gaiellaceae bacterium]
AEGAAQEALRPAMSDELRIEAEGETVGEAKWAALRELELKVPGLDRDTVRFEVLTEGERGLLGVGYTPARVAASVDADGARAAAPAREDETPLGELVRELVERVAAAAGVPCRVDVHEDDERITAVCTGPDLGLLIGRHGQTIDALQYLANAITARRGDGPRKQVVVDAAGYRDRRRVTLESLAVRSAERALSDHEPVDLEPMTAIERKVVHLRLKEFDGVETTSEGTEPNRYVVVHPL